METKKDWIVRYYDKENKLIGSYIIKDSTRNEANNDAIDSMDDILSHTSDSCEYFNLTVIKNE